MKVFISWSKNKSKEFALITKILLEEINPGIEAFVSEIDINGGEDVQNKIIEKIIECDALLLCFTKENKRSPWLLFEAGYARGLKKKVIPLLFDSDQNWHSWIDNPMNIAREIKYESPEFISSFLNCFGISSTDESIKSVKSYIETINQIKDKFRLIDIQCEDLVDKLLHNDEFVMKNPFFRDKSAFFLSGFESYDLLKVITDTFLYTGKYLWIYGRKNMKLFSGSFKKFFRYLHEKSANDCLGMAGIDFRCLFLDPTSEEVKRAHIHRDIFENELSSTILRAKNEIGMNSKLGKCFRYYSNRREEIIIRVDNSIIYSKPSYDANGCPQLLTNTAFEICSVSSIKGKDCVEKFENIWLNSRNMF